MSSADSTCCAHDSQDDEVTPLEAAQVAYLLHNNLAAKIMGLVELLSAAQRRGHDPLLKQLDVPKLRKTVGLAKSVEDMNDCLAWLCPDFEPLFVDDEEN